MSEGFNGKGRRCCEYGWLYDVGGRGQADLFGGRRREEDGSLWTRLSGRRPRRDVESSQSLVLVSEKFSSQGRRCCG